MFDAPRGDGAFRRRLDPLQGRLVAVHVQRERGGSAVVGADLDRRAQRVAFAVVWGLAPHAWAPHALE